MLFKKKELKIDVAVMGDQLNSIRTALLEIRTFDKKKITASPTSTYWKPVNIEHAWPDCRELYSQTYQLLQGIAERFGTKLPDLPADETFSRSLELFVESLDELTLRLADALGTGTISETELINIDNRIIEVQNTVNRIRKHVQVDFIYPAVQNRPPIRDN